MASAQLGARHAKEAGRFQAFERQPEPRRQIEQVGVRALSAASRARESERDYREEEGTEDQGKYNLRGHEPEVTEEDLRHKSASLSRDAGEESEHSHRRTNMCGRYTLKTDRRVLEKHFRLPELPDFLPRYNLGPTQDGLIVRTGDRPGKKTVAWLRWGLIPGWARADSDLPLLINARVETAASRPAFRDAWRHRRCLVLADGFYEWTRAGRARIPHHFTIRHGEPFAMAGLWERFVAPNGDAAIETFAILTTSANEVVAPHHDRMPAILDPSLHDDWVNPLVHDADVLRRMLGPFPAIEMVARRVDTRVNDIRHDDPECLASPCSSAPANHDRNASGQLGLDFR
jgi:putative SOS response-associated peptidase YedK